MNVVSQILLLHVIYFRFASLSLFFFFSSFTFFDLQRARSACLNDHSRVPDEIFFTLLSPFFMLVCPFFFFVLVGQVLLY